MIIDIGSGNRPHCKADILLELYSSEDEQRWNKKLTADRITILYKGNTFPLKDKSFDFSICKHVLEHVKDPRVFLSEVERISRRGYIETPNEIAEVTFTPYDKHLWIIGDENGLLTIRKKYKQNNSKLGKLFDYIIGREEGFEDYFYKSRRKLFLVEYFWKDRIRYKFLPSQVSLKINLYDNDLLKIITVRNAVPYSIKQLDSLKRQKSLKYLNSKIEKILRCPKCEYSVVKTDCGYLCKNCGRSFLQKGNIIEMI